MTIKLIVDGKEYTPTAEDRKAVAIEMWYDRHRREWVLYPVDNEGNQLNEAVYGFGKDEAKRIRKELEAEWL